MKSSMTRGRVRINMFVPYVKVGVGRRRFPGTGDATVERTKVALRINVWGRVPW